MKKYVQIARSHAVTIQRHYRCAGCWNPLIVGFDKQGDYLECATEDCSIPGLVSAKWVETQLAQQEAEAVTMRKILQESFEWLRIEIKDKRTREKAIAQLGF